MINETPNKLELKSGKLSWFDGVTFFAFKSPSGKIYAAQSFGSEGDFSLKINDVDLSNYVIQNFRVFIKIPLDHESLANLIHLIKPELIKKNCNREEFLFSGRLWVVGGTRYVSLWNSKSKIESHINLLKKILKDNGTDLDKCLFEFPENQGKYKPFGEISTKVDSVSSDREKKFMSQIHTLPPGAKKWAMRGMSIQEILSENPDSLYTVGPDEYELTFDDGNVICVFSILYLDLIERYIMVNARVDNGHLLSLTTNDPTVDKQFKLKKYEEKIKKIQPDITHYTILRPFLPEEYCDRNQTELSGRVWYFERKYYVSFWQSKKVVKSYKQDIESMFIGMNINPKIVLYEVLDGNGLLTYDEVFGSNELSIDKIKKLSSDEIKKLMMKQHLDPNAKRILKSLADLAGPNQNSIEKAANAMNISVAQLKNQLTAGD